MCFSIPINIHFINSVSIFISNVNTFVIFMTQFNDFNIQDSNGYWPLEGIHSRSFSAILSPASSYSPARVRQQSSRRDRACEWAKKRRRYATCWRCRWTSGPAYCWRVFPPDTSLAIPSTSSSDPFARTREGQSNPRSCPYIQHRHP